MEFDEWEPVYEAICSDFGYDRAGDERGRDLLASLLEKSFDLADLSFVGGATAAIAGRARRSRPSGTSSERARPMSSSPRRRLSTRSRATASTSTAW